MLVYATALIGHELVHALVGLGLGGEPTLISSTDTRGDWSGLGEMDVLLVGVSGSAMNGLISLSAWLAFRGLARRRRELASVRHGGGSTAGPTVVALIAWLAFVVNAWIPVSYLVVSPTFGFGDWATIVDQFPNRGPLRASLAVTGLFIAGLLWKETKTSLARLVGNGSSARRTMRASRIVRAAWLGGGSLAVVAAMLSPLDLLWALGIGVGSTFGTTWPLLLAVDSVAEHPVPGGPLHVPRSWMVVALGAMAGAVLVGVFGPGLHLGA